MRNTTAPFRGGGDRITPDAGRRAGHGDPTAGGAMACAVGSPVDSPEAGRSGGGGVCGGFARSAQSAPIGRKSRQGRVKVPKPAPSHDSQEHVTRQAGLTLLGGWGCGAGAPAGRTLKADAGRAFSRGHPSHPAPACRQNFLAADAGGRAVDAISAARARPFVERGGQGATGRTRGRPDSMISAMRLRCSTVSTPKLLACG